MRSAIFVALAITLAGAAVSGTLLYIHRQDHRCDRWKAAVDYTASQDSRYLNPNYRQAAIHDVGERGEAILPGGSVVHRPAGCTP